MCVWESMLPAPKKSSDLNSEWLSVWSSAPESPQIAASLVARTLAQRRDAQSDQDDADVFDRRVGQQPLHVVLRRGEDHSPESRDDACDEQDQACGAERRQVGDLRRDAQDAVDARLDHHARHQGRDVRRGGGMRFGQPDVHREHAGLHAEARKEDHEQRQGGLRAEIFAQQGEVGRSADAVQPHEADEQQGESHVHHDHVGQRGAAHFAALGVEQDQQERCDGHQAPRKRGMKIRLRRSLRPAWRRTSSPARCSAARCGPGICVRGNARDIPASRAPRRRPRPRRSARTAPKEGPSSLRRFRRGRRRSPTTVRCVRRQALRRPLPTPRALPPRRLPASPTPWP